MNNRINAGPPLKWAGGKRALIPEILEVFPEFFNDYYEPFLGGGAVFFALASRARRKMHLSDLNAELMLVYKMLKSSVRDVISVLEKHESSHSKEYYNLTRESGHLEQDPVKLAARFIYLNKTCYNGLYRVNRKGRFNVPMGNYKNPKICDKENLLAVSNVLQQASLKAQSFEQTQPKNGDMVYCDPPYDQTFAQYTANGFRSSDQIALLKSCNGWLEAGANVVISSSDTRFIRELWSGYKLIEVLAPRNINCRGDGRNKVTELLIIGIGK